MFEVEVPIEDDGLHEVAIAFKHALHSNDVRIVSLGLETAITGDTAIFEPFVSAGTMLSEWYLQGEVKFELPIDRVKADRAFVYNAYLGRDTSQSPQTWTLGVEFNGENDDSRSRRRYEKD